MLQYARIRKPLLLIASILSSVLFLHIVFIYLYSGSQYFGQIGGTISVGIVSNETPSLNPIEYGLDTNNDTIIRFLFRSLVRYNPNTEEYEGDLANCDLTKGLTVVQCELKDGILWSDGAPIKKDDIIATYKAFRESPTNRALQTFLEGLTITEVGDSIRFESKYPSAQMVDILTFPVVRSSMITDIREGRFNKKEHYITSGPYTYLENEQNTEKGFERVSITRNDTNGGGTFIGKYHFKFFKNSDALQKNQDTLNIIIPRGQSELPKIPRFGKHIYHTYEYVAGFLNVDSIPSSILRSNILFHLSTAKLDTLIKTDAEPIKNLFFSEKSMIPSPTDKNIAHVMRELEYYKPGELIGSIDASIHETGSLIETGTLNTQKLKYFNEPSNSSIQLISNNQGEVLLSGKVPVGVNAVYINNYKLAQFKPGNTQFYYRARKETQTLIEGGNFYTLSFEYKNGKVIRQESITIYFYTNKDEKDKKYNELIAQQTEKINTPELIAKKIEGLEKIRNEYRALDPRYYYKKDKTPFTFTIKYFEQGNNEDINTITKEIQKKLIDIGIQVIIQPIEKQELVKIQEGEKKYDMLIIGFDAPSRITNIIPIFHTTEAKKGINFSKIRSKKLDTLLDEFRLNTYNKTERKAIEESLITEIQKEAIILPFYSPNRLLYIDKNMKNLAIAKIIPNIDLLAYMLEATFIKDELVMSFQGKGLTDFFRWAYIGFIH